MSVIQVYVKRNREQPAVLAGEIKAASGELEFVGGRGVLRGGAMNEIRQLLELYCGGPTEGDFSMVYEGTTLDACHINSTAKQFDFTYTDPSLT